MKYYTYSARNNALLESKSFFNMSYFRKYLTLLCHVMLPHIGSTVLSFLSWILPPFVLRELPFFVYFTVCLLFVEMWYDIYGLFCLKTETMQEFLVMYVYLGKWKIKKWTLLEN